MKTQKICNPGKGDKTEKNSKPTKKTIECNNGIDISKEKIHVASLPNGNYEQVPNIRRNIKAYFKKCLKGKKVGCIVMEATGGYEKRAANTLTEMGYYVCVLNPLRAHYLLKGMGENPKTDKCDAQMLAKIAQRFKGDEKTLPRYTPLTLNQQKLKHLVDRSKQLVNRSVCCQNEIKRADATDDSCIKSMKRELKWTKKELDSQTQLLQNLIDSDSVLKKLDEILQSVPGIGTTTSAMLMAYLPELGILNREEIASLAGLAPHPNDSGQKTGKRKTKCGRVKIKAYMYAPMLCVIQHNPTISAFYNRLVENGKAKMVALVASTRKLLTILNVMVRNKQKWNEHLQPQKTDSNANPTTPSTTQQATQNTTVAEVETAKMVATEQVVEKPIAKKSPVSKKSTVAKRSKTTTAVKSVACQRKTPKRTTTDKNQRDNIKP